MGSARFILGRAGSGKTRRILDEIAGMLGADPLGPPILVLVPDQATLLYEQQIAAASPTRGFARLSVITFRQLVELLLNEGGGAAIPEVTPLGRRILIGRLLRRLQPELQFYRSTARQPGLANQLDEAFAELEHSGKTPDDLEFLASDIESDSPRSPLPAKLRDLRLVYRDYEKLLGNERLDQHRRVRAALESAGRSPTLQSATLFVDAFYDFTQTDRRLLAAAIKAGARARIALTIDPADASPGRLDDVVSDEHPFRLSTLAYRKLHRALRDEGIVPTIEAPKTLPRYDGNDDLRNIDVHFTKARPSPATRTGEQVRLIEAPSRRAEVDAAARQIIDWTTRGLRFRDILVLARDVDPYFRHLDASFREHAIPFFIDRQRPAMHDPLIRTVRAMSQVTLGDFAIDAVVDLLKSGLCGISGDTVDAIEHYLIDHRIRGMAAWGEEWAYRRRTGGEEDEERFAIEDLGRINEGRRAIIIGLQPLLDCEDAQTCTAAIWCGRICESLDRLGVRDALIQRIADAERENDLAGAATHREVWSEFGELLDQLATVLGDEVLSLREFTEVVDVALERFTLTITPPTIDQVLVGGVERTRTGPIKACIVLGMSEGIFPARRDQTAALTDDDRRILDARQVELKVGSRTLQLDEQFLAYLALSRASECLTVTRPTVEDDGRTLAPSTFWTQLRALFRGGLPVETIRCTPEPTCIATPRQLVEATIDWATAVELPLADRQLVTWMHHSDLLAIAALRRSATDAVRYENDASLSPSIANALYESPLRASATRLETYAACPFKQFAQHALKLEPREDEQVTHLDLGLVYHRVLENLVRGVIDERRDPTVPMEDLADRIDALSRAAAGELRNELLLQPGRNAYLLDDVRRTLADVVETQRRQLALGQFRPRHAEFSFGLDDKRSAPPLEIVTPKGRTVHLRGRIDRVDTIALGDRLAATVIDYKLGMRKPEFDRIYFGLSLQLVTYLLVLSALGERITGGTPVAPAAALFVKLGRAVENVDHPDDAAEPGTDSFFLNGATKARGVIDENFATRLDEVVPIKKDSQAYGIKNSPDPIELKRRDVLDHTTFRSLVEWTRTKIGELADEMAGGRIEVRPFRLKTITPCPTCDFRPVCRLDLAFNRYAEIQPQGDGRLAQIVEAMNR